jgi:N-acetylmuramoyl-L-alanine amidase
MVQEKPSDKFLKFVSAVKAESIEFPELKPYLVAQAILECGRGITELFDQYNNPFGMHYHDFLAPYGIGVQYVACDGPGLYTKFDNYSSAIKGFYKWFDAWAHYGDWRTEARKGGLAFLKHIGPFYCPPGFTESWKTAHGGLDYADYIVNNLLVEAKVLLNDATATPDKPTPKPVPKDFTYLSADTAEAKNLVNALVSNFPKEFSFKLYKPPTDTPVEPPKPPNPPTTAGKKILLNPGHSASSPGADGLSSSVHEEVQNLLAANIMASDLRAAGHTVDIFRSESNDLQAVGDKAKGYDAAYSLHHNAFDKKEHYVWIFGPSGEANQASKDLGAKITAAIGKALNLADNGMEKSGYTVPNLFAKNCKGPSGLIEFYFIDAYGDLNVVNDRTTKAAHAMAGAMIKYFG